MVGVDTAKFIAQVRAEGIKLWAEGDKLRLTAPEGKLRPEWHAQLTAEKAAVLACLRRETWDTRAAVTAWSEAQRAVMAAWADTHGPRCAECPIESGGHAAFYALEAGLRDEIDAAWYAFDNVRVAELCGRYRDTLVGHIPVRSSAERQVAELREIRPGRPTLVNAGRDSRGIAGPEDDGAPWADYGGTRRPSVRAVQARPSDDTAEDGADEPVELTPAPVGKICRECSHVTGSYTRLWCACCLERRYNQPWILEGALCGGGRDYELKRAWRG